MRQRHRKSSLDRKLDRYIAAEEERAAREAETPAATPAEYPTAWPEPSPECAAWLDTFPEDTRRRLLEAARRVAFVLVRPESWLGAC